MSMYGRAANADMITTSSPTGPAFVISCIVTSAARPGMILLGVRRWSATSQRHPGVLSTFTMRVPEPLFRSFVAAADLDALTSAETLRPSRVPAIDIGSVLSSASPASFAIESLLARKLELGGALARAEFRATAWLSAIALDDVPDPQGGDSPELTMMASFCLEVTEGVELLPTTTGAYSVLTWVPFGKLGAAYKAHDALILDPSLNPFEVCISGLCIRAAVEIFEDAAVS
jgi:hypothetical protein